MESAGRLPEPTFVYMSVLLLVGLSAARFFQDSINLLLCFSFGGSQSWLICVLRVFFVDHRQGYLCVSFYISVSYSLFMAVFFWQCDFFIALNVKFDILVPSSGFGVRVLLR